MSYLGRIRSDEARGHGKEMMHHKAIQTLGNVVRGDSGIGAMSIRTLSVGVLCGAFAVACAGGDTPARDDDLEAAIAQAYANGQGVAGSGPSPSGGSGGRPPAGGAGGGGNQGGSNATSGAGGAPGGSGGTAAEGGAAGSGSMGNCDTDDGLQLLLTNCRGSTCHSAGSSFNGFAENEDALLDVVDENGTSTCASAGPLLDPGNPPASIIVQKLKGTATCGGQMPLASPPLSAEDIQCIEDWIGTL